MRWPRVVTGNLVSVRPMAERQRDKGVIVTGAARGIGRAIAGHLARRGWQVALVDIDGEAVGAAAGEIGGAALEADVGRGAGREGPGGVGAGPARPRPCPRPPP